MRHTLKDNESVRCALGDVLGSMPPPRLRARVLAQHRSVRNAKLACLGGALSLLVFVLLAGVRSVDSLDHELAALQARTLHLEAQWRQTGDPQWLVRDERARQLLQQLQGIDLALDRYYREGLSRRAELAVLWRQRDATLTALVEFSQRGTTAIRI